MIEQCGKARDPRSYHVARACTLAPDAVADASLPGRLAEKELKDSAREFWSLTEQGAPCLPRRPVPGVGAAF